MIGPYIALAWSRNNAEASRVVAGLRQTLGELNAWSPMLDRPGQLVLARSTRPISVRRFRESRGLVIGDLFDANGASAPSELLGSSASPCPPEELGRQMLTGFWGRYIAVFTSSDGSPEGVLRDPSGALECLCWMGGELFAASNDPPDALIQHGGGGVSIDWDSLADHLSDPSLISARSALKGMHTVTPGALRAFGKATDEKQLWRPSTFAMAAVCDGQTAERGLVDSVDLVVGALSKRRRILAEVSGGLDSSMVASALTRAAADVGGWVTFVSDDPAGDETFYADALGRALGLVPLRIRKSLESVTPGTISATQNGVEVSLNALDRQYDLHILTLAGSVDAEAVFTGFGGDAVFFQMANPAIIEDLVARLGRRMLLTPALGGLARWTRRSIYELAWRAVRPGRRVVAYPTGGLHWRRHRASTQAHPWCADIDGLPPAKRLHIISLTHMLSAYGRSRRGSGLDVVHPLLTQPVLEQALRTPVDLLVAGWRDRGLARRAFRGRLPELILERRSKGDLGILHAENFVAGLPELRPFLLDGRLVQEGLIDPVILDAAMDESTLSQHGGVLEILHAVATEAWVRQWSARLDRLQSQGGVGGLAPPDAAGA